MLNLVGKLVQECKSEICIPRYVVIDLRQTTANKNYGDIKNK